VADTVVTLASAADIATRQVSLRQYIWGSDGLPTTLPASRSLSISNPFNSITNLARVDLLSFTGSGETMTAWHLIPTTKRKKVVFVNCGHQDTCTPSGFGPATQRVLDYLIPLGYSVVVWNMPKCGNTAGHDQMFTDLGAGAMHFFLDPLVQSINYFQTPALVSADSIPTYSSFHMATLSGGGWTAVVYAALDPRIESTIATSGSLPLDARYGSSVGDTEQTRADFYAIAGYRDLYVMGGYGPGRSLLNVFNRNDSQCFGLTQHDAVAYGLSWDAMLQGISHQVRPVLRAIDGGGRYTQRVDEDAANHTISTTSLPWLLDAIESRRLAKSPVP
jgi:hypothetical protein